MHPHTCDECMLRSSWGHYFGQLCICISVLHAEHSSHGNASSILSGSMEQGWFLHAFLMSAWPCSQHDSCDLAWPDAIHHEITWLNSCICKSYMQHIISCILFKCVQPCRLAYTCMHVDECPPHEIKPPTFCSLYFHTVHGNEELLWASSTHACAAWCWLST